MKPATPKQLQSIHAALHRKGLLAHKAEMVSSYTNGRSKSSKDMTIEEASAMLKDLNEHKTEQGERDRMIRSIMAMLLLSAVCFAVRTSRLFVAESLYRNIGVH